MRETITVHIPAGLDLNSLTPRPPLEEREPETSSGVGDFPVEVFPEKLQTLIRVAWQTLTFPPDFLAASLLYAASLAVGNSCRVAVKKGWYEKGVLYLAVVGKPGTNKSHPLSYALAPFFARDKKNFRQYKQALADYEEAPQPPKGEPLPPKPELHKTLVSDFTPEALAETHSQNPRGIGVYVDELVSWIRNFNRYNKGSEEQFWLSNWSGKPVISDRKSCKLFIDEPFISVAGTIQNAVLTEMAQDKRGGNGFMDRILFVIPDHLEKSCWNLEEMPEEITLWYHALIGRLMGLPVQTDAYGNQVPVTLSYTPEARERLFAWQRHNTALCNHSESDALTSQYAKLEIYISRIALLLQMLDWSIKKEEGTKGGTEEGREEGGGEENSGSSFVLSSFPPSSFPSFVSLEAVEGAIAVTEFFRRSGHKVHDILWQNGAEPLKGRDKQLYEALPEQFTLGQGVEVAQSLGIPKIRLRRFLQKTAYFHKLRHGEYEKQFLQ
jgi:hypothetical protein